MQSVIFFNFFFFHSNIQALVHVYRETSTHKRTNTHSHLHTNTHTQGFYEIKTHILFTYDKINIYP